MRPVSPRRSLVTRLLAMTLAVCAISVAATAWLVMHSTDAAVQQVNGQTLQNDAIVYDALLTWAQEHPDWSGVQSELARLAAQTGYRILLTDTAGTPVADSEAQARPVSVSLADTRVIVDPTQIDWSLLQHAPGRGAGPTTAPTPAPAAPPRTPAAAPDPSPDATAAAPTTAHSAGAASATAATGSAQAAPRRPTAPPVRLFITGRPAAATTFFDLSPASRLRIAAIAALVLAVATGVSIVVGLRITRPLRELAGAARRMSVDDDARALVRTRDEIGEVAAAFNTLAARRSEQERLRRAMVGDVAHELRSPLASVRGWLEAAQDGLTPIDRDLVDSLHEDALHLQDLVADLQDLALGDAGELKLHREALDVTALLDQVVRSHGAQAAAKSVDLSARTVPGLVVHADPQRLRQAVTNLTTNALRHTPAGGTITVTGENGPGDAVVIRVRDTGEGISADDLPHVFDRFWRADPSRTRGTGGSGLGLAIVRQVVEIHGGTVTAASEPGVGTTFTLTIPGDAE